MARLIDRASYVRNLSEMRGQRDFVRAAVDKNDPTEAIASWLRQLKKLNGVPFNYLVPNQQMLPNESIRFFNVDFNWLFAMVEGACSIGQATEEDTALHAMTADKLHAAAPAPDVASGFLLRSQVVPGWPKLEVRAFDANGTLLTNVLRMDRITNSILLFLVAGQIDHVILREPAIGLHFGIDVSGGKALRYVTVPASAPANTQPGDEIAQAVVTPEFRDATHRTIRMAKLAGDLSSALQAHEADNAPDGSPLPFTSAEYALELVEGTQEVTFKFNPTGEGAQ